MLNGDDVVTLTDRFDRFPLVVTQHQPQRQPMMTDWNVNSNSESISTPVVVRINQLLSERNVLRCPVLIRLSEWDGKPNEKKNAVSRDLIMLEYAIRRPHYLAEGRTRESAQIMQDKSLAIAHIQQQHSWENAMQFD